MLYVLVISIIFTVQSISFKLQTLRSQYLLLSYLPSYFINVYNQFFTYTLSHYINSYDWIFLKNMYLQYDTMGFDCDRTYKSITYV